MLHQHYSLLRQSLIEEGIGDGKANVSEKSASEFIREKMNEGNFNSAVSYLVGYWCGKEGKTYIDYVRDPKLLQEIGDMTV